MSQINSNTKDDFQVVFLFSCFVGHPVYQLLQVHSFLIGQISYSFDKETGRTNWTEE